MDFNQQLKVLRILSFGLISGVIVIMAVFYFLTQQEGYAPLMTNSAELLLIISAVIVASGYMAADVVSKTMLSSVKEADTETKLTRYRAVTIARMAIYEMTLIMAMIFFYISGHIGQLIIALLAFAIMLINIPDKKKIMEKLNLKEDELN